MKISILGCGNMGAAIIKGIKKAHGDCEVEAWDSDIEKARELEKTLGLKIKEPQYWFSGEGNTRPSAVIIAVKPQVFKEALSVFANVPAGENTVWISVAAGISVCALEKILPSRAVARVMPNTPALIGEGCSLYSLNSLCDKKSEETVEKILNSIGICVKIPETQMNAATGLSGSGPAFVYTIIEAFAEAGVAAGLPYELALKCSAKTVLGGAKMVLETGENPSLLKSRVMSAGGTTAAGNIALENGGVRAGVMSAVMSAVKKADELTSINT